VKEKGSLLRISGSFGKRLRGCSETREKKFNEWGRLGRAFDEWEKGKSRVASEAEGYGRS